MDSKILIPIFIAVVLPVSIVFIVNVARMYKHKKETELLAKAIESNKDIDTDRLIEMLYKPRCTARQRLMIQLYRGCVLSLLGLVFVIFGVVGLTFDDFSLCDSIPALMLGSIFFAIGFSYFIVYFVSRKHVDDDK